LGGTGVITGPVSVSAGSLFTPGSGYGTLTVSNTLALAAGSTNYFAISRSPLTNSAVLVYGTITNGGTLVVTNAGGGALAAGDAFKLINATGYAGAFANIILPALPVGLAWNTNALNTNGTVSVLLTAKPVTASILTSSSGLVMHGSGGVGNGNYYVLGSTNLTAPLTNWTRLLTNQFDSLGGFGFTNTLLPGSVQDFYLLEIP
jgi:hypothetical protein